MLFLLVTLGLGLLVSTIVRNQQQAMMGAAFVGMLPMVYLSGLIFPIDNMPPAIQTITYAHPAALLRRDHPRHLPARLGHRRRCGPRRWSCWAMGIAIMTIASLRFRKRLD